MDRVLYCALLVCFLPLVCESSAPSAQVEREVWLTYSQAGQHDDKLDAQYQTYKKYKDSGALTHSSLLMYCVYGNGTFGTDCYETSKHDATRTSRQFQQQVKSLGLKAIPCFYCDTDEGFCPELVEGLKNIYKNPDSFIDATIKEAQEYGWDGYAVDFELQDSAGNDDFSQLMINWGAKLKDVGMSLSLRTGNAAFDLEKIGESGSVSSMITMTTYFQTVAGFEIEGDHAIKKVGNPSMTGFGIDTSGGHNPLEKINGDGMKELSKWARQSGAKAFSIFEASFPDEWIDGLKDFISAGEASSGAAYNLTMGANAAQAARGSVDAAAPQPSAFAVPQLRGAAGHCGCATWAGDVCVCGQCCASYDSWCKSGKNCGGR